MKGINWKQVERAVDKYRRRSNCFSWDIPGWCLPDPDNPGDHDIYRVEPWPVEDQYAVIQMQVESQGIRVNWKNVWLDYLKWQYKTPRPKGTPFEEIKRLCRKHRIKKSLSVNRSRSVDYLIVSDTSGLDSYKISEAVAQALLEAGVPAHEDK